MLSQLFDLKDRLPVYVSRDNWKPGTEFLITELRMDGSKERAKCGFSSFGYFAHFGELTYGLKELNCTCCWYRVRSPYKDIDLTMVENRVFDDVGKHQGLVPLTLNCFNSVSLKRKY